ncbi:hypothetical protein CRYUN_Cryun27aG0031900 [Craigia yunnanensis]
MIIQKMAFMILFLLLLLSFILNTANAQPRNSSIRPGSSLSPDNNSYWLSESGQFAFGFYPYGNGFSVGIWFEKIQQKTVVWTANRDGPPFHNDVTLLLSTEGRLIVQLKQGQETLIADASQSASSASVLDSGNFVLLNSSSGIIWQAFDFPTDTILPSQRLLTGHKPVSSVSETNHSSGKFHIFMQNDGNLVQYPEDSGGSNVAYWDTKTQNTGDGVTLNLDSNGLLYLLNATGFNVKNLSSTVNASKSAYRATIDADGIFRLYSHGLGEPDSYSAVSSLTGDACRENCIRDISCEAAIYVDQECQKLKLPLRFGRKIGDPVTTFLKAAKNDGKGNNSEREMGIFITSIVFLTLAFFVLAFSCVLVYRYRVRRYQKISNPRNNGFAEDLTLRSFSYEELKDASNNFTDEISKGSCGTVFKGVLSNGNRIVAIKRLEK